MEYRLELRQGIISGVVRMFYASYSGLVTGARSGRRKRALAAIALWLWSSWVIAAGCCCEAVDSADAAVAAHPLSASSADEHRHDHGHASSGDNHSQDTLPADDCAEIKAPVHGIAPKEAAPPPSLVFDHLALAPSQIASWPGLSGHARHDWSLPPPPILPGDPFLETVRLLL